MNRFLANLLLSICLLNFFSNGQLFSKPFHLTDGQNGDKFISYRATEQCLSNGTDEAKKQNGLTFHLPPGESGNCDDGLLICYPSSLQSNSDAFIFQLKDTFNFEGKKETKICKECAEKMANDGISADGNHWRGLKVYTRPKPNGNQQKRDTILEASLIASEIFTIGEDQRQFSLLYDANRSESFTMISPMTKNANSTLANQLQLQLQNDFFGSVPKGAFLEEYAGLWLLGLDMLPMMPHQKIKLYINRGCSCTMEAWFIRPTDSEVPTDPKTPTVGSKSCRPFSIDRSFTIQLIGDQQSVTIRALTDANIKSATVELIDAKNQSMIKIKIGTNDSAVTFPKNRKIIKPKTRFIRGASEMKLEILPRSNYFMIFLNGKKFGQREQYFSKNWWEQIQWKEDIKVKVQGELKLLQDPFVMPNLYNILLKKLPFFQEAELLENSTFRFRIVELSGNFTVTFSDDKNFKELANQTAFIVQIDTQKKEVALKVFYRGKWQKEEEMLKNDKNIGNALELFVNVSKEFYSIKLNDAELWPNYSNAMPFCNIKYVKAEGNAFWLEEPKVKKGSKASIVLQNGTVETRKYEKFMPNYGDKIVIELEKLPKGTEISVNFARNSAQCSKIYDEVALISFFVGDTFDDKRNCQHKLSKEKSRSKSDLLYAYEIPESEELNLEILMAKDGFYGRRKTKDASRWVKLCPYYMPSQKNISQMPIPPWIIDHVQVYVSAANTPIKSVELKEANSIDYTALIQGQGAGVMTGANLGNIERKRIKYLKVKENGKAENYWVNVSVPFDKQHNFNDESEVRVGFFNGALERHDLYGKTVLLIVLKNENVTFQSFMGPKNQIKLEPQIDMERILNTEGLDIAIHVTKEQFVVEMNGQNRDNNGQVLQFSSQFVQSIEYITAEYEHIDLGKKNMTMKCDPSDKCFSISY